MVRILSIALIIIGCSVNSSLQKNATFEQVYMEYKKECQTETGVDVALATQVWIDRKMPNDEKLKCFFKCAYLKAGVLNAAGEVVDDVFKLLVSQYFSSPGDIAIFEACKTLQGDNLCETAYKLVKCMIEEEM